MRYTETGILNYLNYQFMTTVETINTSSYCSYNFFNLQILYRGKGGCNAN